jgi:hypothetical protein
MEIFYTIKLRKQLKENIALSIEEYKEYVSLEKKDLKDYVDSRFNMNVFKLCLDKTIKINNIDKEIKTNKNTNIGINKNKNPSGMFD